MPHRNGEKTPPTEPGIYRFFGKRYGKHLGAKDVELIVTDEMPIPDVLSVLWGSIYEGFHLYEGRWWGPIRSLEDHDREYWDKFFETYPTADKFFDEYCTKENGE